MKCQWCLTNEVVRHDSLMYLLGLAEREETVCPTCLQTLFNPILPDHRCQGCGRKGEYTSYCKDCRWWIQKDGHLSVYNTALFEYSEHAKEWMSRYKFMGDCRLAKMMRRPLREALQQYTDYQLVPLPSSKASLKKRNFDAVSYLLDVHHISYIQPLVHIGTGKKQSDKTRSERLLLQQPFAIRKHLKSNFVKILLIDDVYTTGATLHKAAQCLFEYDKNLKIKSLTLFR